MSKVPYTVDVDRYICTELEEIRTMIKTYDFSRLLSTIERIQHHANAMEDALYTGRDRRYVAYRKLQTIVNDAKDKKLTKKESALIDGVKAALKVLDEERYKEDFEN